LIITISEVEAKVIGWQPVHRGGSVLPLWIL